MSLACIQHSNARSTKASRSGSENPPWSTSIPATPRPAKETVRTKWWLCSRHCERSASPGRCCCSAQWATVRSQGSTGRSVRGALAAPREAAAPRPGRVRRVDAFRRQAQRPGQEAVHRGQVGYDLAHGVLLRLGGAVEPLEANRLLPVAVAQVAQQRVEPGGLRVVGAGPLRHRDTGRTAAEAAFQHPGPQQRIEVERLLLVQQPHRVPQPQRLVGAGRALRQVHLQGHRLVLRTGRQRPGAQQRLQGAVVVGRPVGRRGQYQAGRRVRPQQALGRRLRRLRRRGRRRGERQVVGRAVLLALRRDTGTVPVVVAGRQIPAAGTRSAVHRRPQ